MEVVGFSNATLSEFLVSLARKSTSSAALLHALTHDAALTPSDALNRLAADLHERIPKASSVGAGAKRKEPSADSIAHRQAVAEVRKAKSYALVEEGEPALPATISRPPKAKPSKEERKEAKLRKKERKKEKKLRKAMRDSSSSSSDSDSDSDEGRGRGKHDAAASASCAAGA